MRALKLSNNRVGAVIQNGIADGIHTHLINRFNEWQTGIHIVVN